MPKLAPLADVTNVNGYKLVFDPGKVSVVYEIPMTILDPTHPSVVQGPIKTHIWGITAAPNPINETPVAFLNRLGIANTFVLLTCLAGPIRIRASSIGLILAQYPGETDPTVKSYVLLGTESKDVWHIKEDVNTVRQKVDVIRQQGDGHMEEIAQVVHRRRARKS
jgi:hypothetical protein